MRSSCPNKFILWIGKLSLQNKVVEVSGAFVCLTMFFGTNRNEETRAWAIGRDLVK